VRVSIVIGDELLEEASKSAIGRRMTAPELGRFRESVEWFFSNELDNSFPWADAIREAAGEDGA